MEQILELEKERISYFLRIDGLESRLNAGAGELSVGEVIVWSPEDLKAHMFAVQGEASDFVGFFCVYNILTKIHQRIKGEDKMSEVMKHKNDLAILKMLEDEAINVYTFSVVVVSLFGGKGTNKSEICYLPTYEKWRDINLQTSLGYELENILDPVHRDIKFIIAE